MNFTFKNTLLAGVLILSPFTAYSAKPMASTTGHKKAIIRSMGKALHINSKDMRNLTIIFQENSYQANNFDISNVEIQRKADKGLIKIDRMINDSKSLQAINVLFTDPNKKFVKMAKITMVDSFYGRNKRNTTLSIDNLTSNVNAHNAFLFKSLKYISKINNKGIEKLYVSLKGLNTNLSTQTQNIIRTLTGNIVFYKTSNTLLNSNYTLKSDLTFTRYDTPNTSTLKNTTNLQMDNKTLRLLLLKFKIFDDYKTHAKLLNNFSINAELTTKFVNSVLHIQNNGFVKYFSKKFPSFSKDLVNTPNLKATLKTKLINPLTKPYDLMTPKETDQLANALVNTLKHNKNLHISIQAKSPMPFPNIYIRLLNKEKVLKITTSNN